MQIRSICLLSLIALQLTLASGRADDLTVAESAGGIAALATASHLLMRQLDQSEQELAQNHRDLRAYRGEGAETTWKRLHREGRISDETLRRRIEQARQSELGEHGDRFRHLEKARAWRRGGIVSGAIAAASLAVAYFKLKAANEREVDAPGSAPSEAVPAR